MRCRSTWLGAVTAGVLALAAAPARAQEGEGQPEGSACATVSAILTQARESGALQRVIGTRHYRLGEGADEEAARRGRTLSVRCELLGEGAEARLVVEQERRWKDGRFVYAETQRFEIGLSDGRTHRSSQLAGAEGKPDPFGQEGSLAGDTFTLTPRPDRGGTPDQFPWTDDTVPTLVVLHVLPALFDQGLPTELRCKALSEYGLGDEVTLLTDPRDDADETREFSWQRRANVDSGEGPLRGTGSVSVDADGRILELHADGTPWVAIEAEAFEALSPKD
jgi:hypothetical protein